MEIEPNKYYLVINLFTNERWVSKLEGPIQPTAGGLGTIQYNILAEKGRALYLGCEEEYAPILCECPPLIQSLFGVNLE